MIESAPAAVLDVGESAAEEGTQAGPAASAVRPEPVAVFMDFENLVLGSGPGPLPDAALGSLCRGFADAAIRRAYADWRDVRFGRYEHVLAGYGTDLIQLGRYRVAAHKNAADIRMTVDVMETVFRHPAIAVFVLATGDSDFVALVTRLREYGKTVIGVGSDGSASSRLAALCSHYRSWDDIAAQFGPDTPDAPPLRAGAVNSASADTGTDADPDPDLRAENPAPPDTGRRTLTQSRSDELRAIATRLHIAGVSRMRKRELIEAIHAASAPHDAAADAPAQSVCRAARSAEGSLVDTPLADAGRLLARALQDLPGPCPTASAVKARMLRLDPDFQESKFGFRNFREFIAASSQTVSVAGHSGHDITLTLTNAAASSD